MKPETVVITGASAGLGRVCLGHVAVDRVGSAKLEMGECAQSEVHHDAAMVERLLELGDCGIAITCR